MDFGPAYLGANPSKDNTGGFVIFGYKKKAYNLLDAGNFLWGQSMKRLGFSITNAKLGAQVNEGFKDSPTDQQAISDGYHYRVLTNTPSSNYHFFGNKKLRR